MYLFEVRRFSVKNVARLVVEIRWRSEPGLAFCAVIEIFRQ
jgi:hypothetical protein